MRWLFHVLPREAYETWNTGDAPVYAPPSLSEEGFVHASYRDAAVETARLYFPPGAELRVLRIDPRKLDVRVEDAPTPRGPMPDVFGPVPRDAIGAVLPLDEVDAHLADRT